MQICCSKNRPFLPIEPKRVEWQDRIQTVARKCFEELSISFTLGVAVALFTSPSGIGLIFGAFAAQSAATLFLTGIEVWSSEKGLEGGANGDCYQKIGSICESIKRLNFAFLTGFNGQTLIHESGHALAALTVYKNPRPAIQIFPFAGGVTQFHKTTLSAVGKWIGPSASTCLIVASGPGLALLVSSILLKIGLTLLEKRPRLGKQLIFCSTFDFLHHAFYAYSALEAERWNLSHDFVHLSIFGLNPLAATIGIIALPLLIALGTAWEQSLPFQKKTAS